MARLASIGFELNSATSGIEYDTNAGATSTISNTHVNGGSWANKIVVSSAKAANLHKFGTTSQYSQVFARLYIYATAFPTGGPALLQLQGNAVNGPQLEINGSGLIGLFTGSGSSIGSQSSAITLNAWNYIELFVNATPASGSRVVTARLNGTQFATTATATSATAFAMDTIVWGMFNFNATGTMYFDDIALNDNTGSFQNTWPGAGQIVMLLPNAAGDSTQWSIGGSSPAATNWQSVNEVTPDDAVTFVSDALTSNSDLYTVGASPLGSSDTVNVVHVGGRFNNPTADATTNFKFQIEKTSGGTISQSASITPNTTTWSTNTVASPHVYPITLYQDPDSSNWTQSTINSMQIGQATGTIGVFGIQMTKVWAMVDYTLSTGLGVTVSDSETMTDTASHYTDLVATREQVTVVIAGSTDLSVTVSDTVTTSESVVALIPFLLLATSDTVTTTESTNELLVSFANVSDTLSTSESIKLLTDENPKVSDTVGTAESITLLNIENVTVSDTQGTSENISVTIPVPGSLSISVSDSVGTSENVKLLIPTLLVSVSDTTATSESVHVSIPSTGITNHGSTLMTMGVG